MLNIVPVLVSVGLQSVNIVCIGLDNHLLSIFSVHRVCISNGFADISTLSYLQAFWNHSNGECCSVRFCSDGLHCSEPCVFSAFKRCHWVLHVHLCFHFDRSWSLNFLNPQSLFWFLCPVAGVQYGSEADVIELDVRTLCCNQCVSMCPLHNSDQSRLQNYQKSCYQSSSFKSSLQNRHTQGITIYS